MMAPFSWWPRAASSYAGEVDVLFLALLALCFLVAASVFGTILFFCIRYREGSTVPRTASPDTKTSLEIAWMAVPLILFLALFAWAGWLFLKMYTPPRDATPIYVTGKQWMWKIEYQDGRREINTLHVPLDQDIVLTMTSEDVIHSFFVPAFRVKKDVVPGRYTQLWFRATRPGSYRLFCSQYCGADHATMTGWVVVMGPSDYQAWLEGADGIPPLSSGGAACPNLASQGGRLFHQFGCAGCHDVNSTIRAPQLEGLYGRPVPLSDGTVVTADDQYLRDSILLPNKQIVAGFAPIMPTFEGRLTEEQVNQLVAYLRSLRDQSPAHASPSPSTP